MSFSSDIKEEILKNFKTAKKCCIESEKFGEYITQIHLKQEIEEEYIKYFVIGILNECCIKSILKGCFLSSGCIVDPNLDYHFEIVFRNKACAEYLYDLLSVLDFTPKLLKRKKMNTYTVYMKEAEQISTFLSMIGANNAVLTFEQIRVIKDVKNNINRSVNCETANLAKTIQTSVTQIEAIEKLKKAGRFELLNDKLRYTAALRLKYKNESLDAISKKTIGDDYISKSGLKHRLDKIIEIANTI
ncbi:MAG: DNA-binding protein WhiA [Clostridia bacterium]|nr:DNA-binding protein WhiA [Clostridia bacterium]